jgi:hypothetical protein
LQSPNLVLARDYLNYYAKEFPKVAQEADPTFSDDPAADVIVVHERYGIDGFFADGDRDLWPEAIAKHTNRPRIVRRTMPLGVDWPLLVAHHTHFELTTARGFGPETTDIADDAVRFRASRHVEGNTVTLDYRYETLADFVPPEKVADHLAVIEKIRNAMDFELDPTVARAKAPEPRNDSRWWFLSFGLIGFAVVAGGVVRFAVGWRQRVRRAAFRRRAAMRMGEAPANPIAVRDVSEISSHLAKERCTCSGALTPVDGAPSADEVRLGDRVLRVVRTACLTCGTPRRVYFHVLPLGDGKNASAP